MKIDEDIVPLVPHKQMRHQLHGCRSKSSATSKHARISKMSTARERERERERYIYIYT